MTVRNVNVSNSWTIEITWLGRPTSGNVWYGKSRYAKAALVKKWREAGAQAGIVGKFPKGLEAFRVEIQARYKHNKLTDFDSMAPTGKALVDGLIDYGLAPDDSGEFCKGMTLIPPFHDPTQPDAVILTIHRVD